MQGFRRSGLQHRLAGKWQADSPQAIAESDAVVTLKPYPRANHVTLIGAFAWPLRWLGPVPDDVQAFIVAAPPVR